MSGRLDGKVTIVTGASRGLGRAIAHALSAAGSSVVVAARVTLHDPRGADNYFADLAVRQELAVLVADANLDVGQRLTD